MIPRPRAEQSLFCHLRCCSPLKQRSAFNPFRRSCALPTNMLMFNSFPDTWGTLITTTEKKQRWGGGGLNVCFVFAIGGCEMNEGPEIKTKET